VRTAFMLAYACGSAMLLCLRFAISCGFLCCTTLAMLLARYYNVITTKCSYAAMLQQQQRYGMHSAFW
jgi:hypothetical protein